MKGTREDTQLVLVHGAFQDGRAWDTFATMLRQNGCQVDIVDLPGREGSPSVSKAIRLEDYVQAIVSTLRRLDRKAVLVCHNFAGIHGAIAASRSLEKVEGIVFLAANIADNGETAYSLLRDYPSFQNELRTAVNGLGILAKQTKRGKAMVNACSEEEKASVPSG